MAAPTFRILLANDQAETGVFSFQPGQAGVREQEIVSCAKVLFMPCSALFPGLFPGLFRVLLLLVNGRAREGCSSAAIGQPATVAEDAWHCSSTATRRTS